ncbi:unnamed protein product [Didymodactylos carnosus]|uniref:Uncharacterized protein n=2 Tax=Didymodactylos carnosus TaxID=1234261 RepID=A0A815BE29_9BILA|nr:unnamed protein product [Didymodactylos carnosus]CAF4054592.1 unnamed protein product [Didymodactylos carnosus]
MQQNDYFVLYTMLMIVGHAESQSLQPPTRFELQLFGTSFIPANIIETFDYDTKSFQCRLFESKWGIIRMKSQGIHRKHPCQLPALLVQHQLQPRQPAALPLQVIPLRQPHRRQRQQQQLRPRHPLLLQQQRRRQICRQLLPRALRPVQPVRSLRPQPQVPALQPRRLQLHPPPRHRQQQQRALHSPLPPLHRQQQQQQRAEFLASFRLYWLAQTLARHAEEIIKFTVSLSQERLLPLTALLILWNKS